MIKYCQQLTSFEMLKKYTIIGAGPSGLAAGLELSKHNGQVVIFDKNEVVGGLARTHRHKGYSFDVGPHRFYTKNSEVLALWKEILKDEFIEVDRLTRIYYKNRLFQYPIQFHDLLNTLTPWEITKISSSYLFASIFYRFRKPETFEDWIVKNFGRTLYEMFFKTYTEKVWGIPCDQIGAEWAAQRIKNLNFFEAARNALSKNRNKNNKVKSLVEKFYYPRHGAGQMHEVMAERIQKSGGKIHLKSRIKKINHHNFTRVDNIVVTDENNKPKTVPVDHLLSSMPITEFIDCLEPAPSKKIINASKALYYRDHITVNLVINRANLFKDNWIYVHSPEVKMARVANYNNFSKDMLANKNSSAISVEYFVFQKDQLWQMKDKDIIKLAIDELIKMNLLKKKEHVVSGFVIRETESYPTYYMGHQEHFDVIKNFVKKFENVELIGRGGQYKYNNMDHAVYSGLLAAKKMLGTSNLDPWAVNEDAEYLEEKRQEQKKNINVTVPLSHELAQS